ncbi:acyl-CoA thioesterase [Pseudoroseomonas globiformis]|uniref:Acyl-CoA thioesterase n=1 Tax=Teichococcus globiformis TaxID=2307229 RepID=A0ABV7FZN5_9PROT
MAKIIPTREDYRYFLEIPTRWADQDAYRHVNNAVYYTYFDTLVASFLGSLALAPEQDGIGVVVETMCRHHTPAFFPETLTAALRAGRIGTSSVRYEIGIFRPGHISACADGHFIHVQVDLADQHRTRAIPERLRNALVPLLTT